MLQYARGHVRIRVTGRSYERFLNMCASHRIILWDLKACDAGYEASLSIKSFKNLKPLARKSGTKIRILEKRGLPFSSMPTERESFCLRGCFSAFS